MSDVFFREISSYLETEKIKQAGVDLLEKIVAEERFELGHEIPLKVHFGEKGNVTFVQPQNFEGIIDYLREKGRKTFFIETNVVYSGSRMLAEIHQETAKEHGFTQVPIVIADGIRGEDFEEVEIRKKHFDSCKIGRRFLDYSQMIVLSHFKGHPIAGFGGAIKQLAMGCASRGGKLAQHVDAKPFIIPFKCHRCGACVRSCPADAIHFGTLMEKIDHKKCLGCAACIAVCPNGSIFVNPFKINFAGKFHEKLAEYAYAAQLGKKNLYISYAFNITKSCDCMGKKMKPIAGDFGVLASVDPVSLDRACMDILDRREGKSVFTGRHTLDYAEAIGLGEKAYRLVQI